MISIDLTLWHAPVNVVGRVYIYVWLARSDQDKMGAILPCKIWFFVKKMCFILFEFDWSMS